MISPQAIGSPAFDVEDPPPPALLCATRADPACAPGITDTAATPIIDVHHARPPAVDVTGTPNAFAGGFGCAQPLELTPSELCAHHSDRGV